MNKNITLSVAALALIAMTSFSGLAYDIAKKEGEKHEHKNFIETDINKNGVPDKVTLIKEAQRDFANYDIVKDPALRFEENGKSVTVPMGEDICYRSSGLESVVISDKVDPFIAVSSCVPHAQDDWLVILYSFDGKALTEQLKITSNEPSIEIKDVDEDGSKDIVVMDRDYENDPKKDKFLTTYKYINNNWMRTSVYRTKTKTLTKL